MSIIKLPLKPPDIPKLHRHLEEPEREPSPELVERIHTLVRTGAPDNFHWEISYMVKEWSRGCDPVVLLLMAISPATGDSVLHTAFIAQRLEMVGAINGMFCSHSLHFPARQFLILHSNNSGDTILHLAARSGLQKMVTAAYRVFHYDSLPDEERFSWPPAEELDLGIEDEDRIPPLMFLVARNEAGRDAADEAQASEHDDIARWLRTLVERIDPINSRSNPEEMCRMEMFLRELYRIE
jgi:hypothetical protein